jgi:hypothetical protein
MGLSWLSASKKKEFGLAHNLLIWMRTMKSAQGIMVAPHPQPQHQAIPTSYFL